MATQRDERFASTGIEGLDDILQGGFPRDRIYLVQGDPGVGKTTLALTFLRDGAARGERGLYVSLSETNEEIRQVATSHGWSLDGISMFELSAVEQATGIDAENTLFESPDVELQETTETVLARVAWWSCTPAPSTCEAPASAAAARSSRGSRSPMRPPSRRKRRAFPSRPA